MQKNKQDSLDDAVDQIYHPPKEIVQQNGKVWLNPVFQVLEGLIALGYGFSLGVYNHQESHWDNIKEAGMLALLMPTAKVLFSKADTLRALSGSRYVFPAALAGLYLGHYYRSRYGA